MARFAIFAVALMLDVPAAYAEMPVYDSEAICSDVAGTSAKQDVVMRGCLDFQERTRKEIALTWNNLPETLQDACVTAARESGDYWKLKSCLDEQAGSGPSR